MKCKLFGNGRGGFGQQLSMRVVIPATTLSRTIFTITQMFWEDLVKLVGLARMSINI